MSDDTDDRPSMAEALEILNNETGQGYLHADHAWELLAAFAREATAEYVADSGVIPDDPDASDIDTDELDMEYVGLALSEDLEEVQRPGADARGIVRAWPHEMLLTYSDVSGILARAVGGEESDFVAGGGGFTADGRHDDNIETIEDALDANAAEA